MITSHVPKLLLKSSMRIKYLVKINPKYFLYFLKF